MIRRIAFVAAAATLAFASFGVADIGASTPLPSGTISCTLSGTAALKPALPGVLPVKPKAIKLKGAGTLSACANGGVVGGKFPITAGTLKLTGSIPAASASCASLLTPVLGKTKVQVKWQGLNPSNKLATVGVSNTFVNTISLNLSPLGFTIVSMPITGGSFVGSTITGTVVLDDSLVTLAGECAGAGIPAFNFTGVPNGPSTISVP